MKSFRKGPSLVLRLLLLAKAKPLLVAVILGPAVLGAMGWYALDREAASVKVYDFDVVVREEAGGPVGVLMPKPGVVVPDDYFARAGWTNDFGCRSVHNLAQLGLADASLWQIEDADGRVIDTMTVVDHACPAWRFALPAPRAEG